MNAGYNIRIHFLDGFFRGWSPSMRAPLTMLFYETLNACFESSLDGMGSTVRDVIYDYLEKKGINRMDIATRFDDVVQVLTDTFGGSARIIIYKTMVELHKEYSLCSDFTYQDSLRDRLNLLKDRVGADHLTPRRVQKEGAVLKDPLGTLPVPIATSRVRSGN